VRRVRREEAALIDLPPTRRRRTTALGILFLVLAAFGVIGMPVAAVTGQWFEVPAFLALALCGMLGYLGERRDR